ncbi:MAG: hypothetical protein KDD38_09765 [Bdellovibrionales bacterium]|nr:hypothetical protein [Bdellovibrionales bacterium]
MNADGQKRLVAVEFILEESSNIVRINIRPPEVKFSGRSNQLEKINSLECVIIDYSLLSEDISAFLKGLSVGTQNANIKTPPGGPNVIVMASETQKINFDLLLESKVFALIYKPLEVRRILYLATQAIKTPFSLYNDENIGWKSEHLPAKISRPAKLVELSEFGVTFKTPHPIKVGTLLYLFKSIFQNAPDQNISVRIYNSEEDESEPGTYLNSAIYFGIADSFLKFTRSYIRETYASSKAKEGS